MSAASPRQKEAEQGEQIENSQTVPAFGAVAWGIGERHSAGNAVDDHIEKTADRGADKRSEGGGPSRKHKLFGKDESDSGFGRGARARLVGFRISAEP